MLRDRRLRGRYAGRSGRSGSSWTVGDGQDGGTGVARKHQRMAGSRSAYGFALGWLVALGLPGSAHGQDAPPIQRPPDSVRATLTGSARVGPVFRGAGLERLRDALNPPPGFAAGSLDQFVSAEASLRLDIDWDPRIRTAVELAHEPFVRDVNQPLGADGLDLILRQLFVEVGGFLADPLTLRMGAFDYSWRLRPHDEPFFLDAGRSDSAFSGLVRTPADDFFVIPTADRDVAHPGGLLLSWRAGDFVQVEAAALVLRERGASGDDESLYTLYAGFPLSERSAGFVAFALATGRHPGDEVHTFGLGYDGYLGAQRELELFVELWLQGGRLAGSFPKRGLGAAAGARWFAGRWWAELSVNHRSGDRDPLDGRDETFVSYENQTRFLIVEDPEAGLDWDTNVTSLRLTGSRRLGASWEARVDVGLFRLHTDLVGSTGADRNTGRRLGTELDATLRHEFSRQVTADLRAAVLTASDLLDDLVPGGPSSVWALVAGLKLAW